VSPSARAEAALPAATVWPARISWAIALLGGGFWSPGDQLTGGGMLAGELGIREPLGVTGDLGLQSNRVTHAEPGVVIAQMQHVSVGARVKLQVTQTSDVWLGLGARGYRLEAASYGYAHDGHAVIFTGGAVAGVEWRRAVLWGLFLSVRLEAQLRSRPEVLTIETLGPVLTVPAWSLGAALGFGYQREMKL
jgi:hypothetical protein